MENNNKQILSDSNYKDLIKIIKKYVNLYKSLHLIDASLASEFKKKQETFHKKDSNKDHSANCCESVVNNQILIPKESQNNIEKNLFEIYQTFYYDSNIDEMLVYLNQKYEKIVKSGLDSGLILDDDTERQLIHRLMIEGVPNYLTDKLKQKLRSYEESISEAPMLLAHPSNISNEDLLNFLSAKNLEELVKNNYTFIDEKFYPQINEYEIYNEYNYLYMEGNFEDNSMKMQEIRTDFIFKHSFKFFKNTKHKTIDEFCNYLYCLPFELNKKFPILQLQTNDYIQASYFRENESRIIKMVDSSFKEGLDTGKKFTVIFALFPDNLELSKRKLKIKMVSQTDNNDVTFLEFTKPLSVLIFKSRFYLYEIDKQPFPFILIFYYIHGPIDKQNFSC